MPQVVTVPFGLAALQPVYPGEAKRKKVRLGPNLSLLHGTILAESNMNLGVYVPYNLAGVATGTNVPKLILEFDCATDAQGNISWATLTVGQSPLAQTYLTTNAFFEGTFYTSDLVGLDANAVAHMGRLLEGTLASGVFVTP